MKIEAPPIYMAKKMWNNSGNRKLILCFWVMFIIARAVSLFLTPLILSRIMGTIQKEGITAGNIKKLILLSILDVGICCVFWTLHGPARIMERANAFRVKATYRKNLLKGVMTLPMSWHTDHHSGDTIDKVEKGTSALYDFSASSFRVIYLLIDLIGSYAVLIYFSWLSGILVIVATSSIVWVATRIDKILIGQYKTLNRAENNIAESVFDSISNITTVIILRVEKLVFRAIENKIEEPYKLFKKNNLLAEFKWCFTSTVSSAMVAGVLIIFFYQNIGASTGKIITTIVIMTAYLRNIREVFFNFMDMYGEIIQRRAKVANAEELSQEFRQESFTNHVLPKNWEKLEINNLNFSYGSEPASKLALKNVSMTIERGERIAVIGQSGSGKTTLLQAIRALRPPVSLEFKVDGKIIAEKFEGIARDITLIPQEPEILKGTVLHNITIGMECDMEYVRKFTDMANFSNVMDALPNGAQSSIEEKGVNLSGGQKQRLALSRGLLACDEKGIVLLDEPTSSLDMETEAKVYSNIFRKFRGKTVISSVHRLHLLHMFDTIYMFREGEIIASGNHEEMKTNCPEFKELLKQYEQTMETSA